MFRTYIWQIKRISLEEAEARFRSVLVRQQALHIKAWGSKAEILIRRIGNILIGQIRADAGVKGWNSWIEAGDRGVIWDGVCETFLGNPHSSAASAIEQIHRVIDKSDDALSDWEGQFAVAGWVASIGKVQFVTGTSACPPMWYTTGPDGFAVGSRGGPLLALVGRKTEPSSGTVNLYLAKGYLFGGNSLFNGVQRFPSGQKLVLSADNEPVLIKYFVVDRYLLEDRHSHTREDLIKKFSVRLISRVKRQLSYSENPKVLLTGGRDSRALAAAAMQTEYPFVVSTGGDKKSKDFLIASEIATRLGIEHEFTGERAAIGSLMDSLEPLKDWMLCSEGIETIRHVLAYPRYLTRELPILPDRQQYFHGLGGETGRGQYYPADVSLEKLSSIDMEYVREKLASSKSTDLILSAAARDECNARLDMMYEDLMPLKPTVAQAFDCFCWRNGSLHWGADLLSVKSPIFFTWLPYLDKELINIFWNLLPQDKWTSRFFEDVVVNLAPGLSDVEYDHVKQRNRIKVIKGKLRKNRMVSFITKLRSMRRKSDPQEAELRELWQMLLFNKKDHLWEEFITRDKLQKIAESTPRSRLLWNAATIELFALAHL